MDAYTLTAIIVVTVGAVTFGSVYLMFNAAKVAAKNTAEILRAPVDASENVAIKTLGAVEDLVSQTVEAARTTAEPISKGIAEICHALAEGIDNKREDLAKSRHRIDGLNQEIERLKNRRISVDQIQPIFQIAFFQSDLTEREFVKEVVKSIPGGLIQRSEVIEYLGVYRAKNTQKFGVDFEDLKFCIVPEDVIQVSGLGKTKLIGNLKAEIQDEHVELRRHLTGGRLKEVHEIIQGDIDNLMITRDRKQRKELQDAITRERRITQIEQGVELMTLQFLKDYFGPRGYTVVKASEALSEPKSIFEIQETLNSQLEKLRDDKNLRLSEALKIQEVTEQALKFELRKLRDADFLS
ncbi:MAG: hypothetical protein ABIV50_09060 [Opitutus sp.]